MTIALVTDSNTQLPAGLRDRYHIRVVPLTVVVDGVAYLEGLDLDPDLFLRRLRAGAEMSTAAPSPGQFAAVYEQAARAGAEGIVSVHVGADLSGTLASARLGAGRSPVPVDLVDTATASFAAGCCVWAAAEALQTGADAAGAAVAARRAADRIGNIFVVSSLELARRGGRLEGGADAAGIPVLALEGGQMHVVAEVTDAAGAVQAMFDYLDRWVRPGERLRAGVGDTDNTEVAGLLAGALAQHRSVVELVRYHVGPSVAVHTGPGTVGAVWTVA